MTDEASASKAVSESLRLLTEDTMMDFTDFAIDSDDDQGQDGLNFDPLSDPLSGTPAAAQSDDKEKVDSPPALPSPSPSNGTSISSALKKETVAATEDPLSGNWPGSKAHRPQTNTNPPPVPTPAAPNHAISHHLPPNLETAGSQSVANLVYKTQSLTSTFSSFASKFQDAVNSATGVNIVPQPPPQVPSINAIFPSVPSPGGGNYVQRSETNAHGIGSANNARSTQMNAGHIHGHIHAPTVYSAPMTEHHPNQEMTSNTQKSSLITSAVGDLITGERVIMYLSNLHNVKDTSSPHTGVGSSTLHKRNPSNDLVWCCAMTFYRIIVFSYYRSEFHEPQQHMYQDGLANHGNGRDARDDMDDAQDLQQWIRSASVSGQFQYLHSSHVRPNGKRHFVLQMPLASIDRIEKTTEFAPTSSQIGFAGASTIMGGSSYNDSVGGSVASGTLIIHGKDNGRLIQFTAPSYAECMRAYEALNTYAFPGRRNLGYLFAFESRREEIMKSVQSVEGDQGNAVSRITSRATPRRYDALTDFRRMTYTSNEIQCPWRPLITANATYGTCQSYPSVLFAPCTVSDETPDGIRVIRRIAAFRSGGRFQTMSWASRFDGASLWRSAQPRVGLQGNRCAEDEMYIKKIGECAAHANSQAVANGRMPRRPSVDFLRMLTGGINESDLMLESFGRENGPFNENCMVKIFDLRPKSSAMANRTAGYGYENTSYYKNTTLSFHGIGNIHAVRDSYQKLSALCGNPGANDVQWLQLVEETKWLSHIRLILSASWQAAFHVRYNRIPVLIHCSHGWDRTSQVCALSQMLLDPYYRTRAGFSCLVEKDFLALGHPLHLRCGHGEGRGDRNNGSSSGSQIDEGQISPIFLQFLDCAFQIVNQYPDFFEFNTKYLLLISEHIYSCRFGSLLCDTEREREIVATIRQRTHCLWEYLETQPELVNKSYKHMSIEEDEFEGNGALLMPLPSLLRNVTLWVDRFCMYSAKPTARSIPNVPLHFDEPAGDDLNAVCHGIRKVDDIALRSAEEEASRWKQISEEKDEIISNLKKQLEFQERKIKGSDE